MFKWLTVVNKKSCFIDCAWFKTYKSNYKRLVDENKESTTNTEFLSCIKQINNKYENIVFIGKHKDINIYITQCVEFDCKGRLSAVSFYCYTVGLTGKAQKIMSLYSAVLYNEELNYIDHIHIQDFIGSEINQGYGSIVMQQFLKFFKTLHVDKVTGFLSFVDLGRSPEHKQLLYHFYQKFGFEIKNDKLMLNLKEYEYDK